MPKFLKLARLYKKKNAPLIFAAADGYSYNFPSSYHFCNFPGSQPKVMFLKAVTAAVAVAAARGEEDKEAKAFNVNDTEKRIPEYMREPLTLYDTANFINKYLSQEYHIQVEKDQLDEMSQPIPTDNDHKIVKTIVGASFDDLVLNNTKDVVVFLHAPWCGLCKRFKRVYAEYAEEARTSSFADKVLFTSMSGSENRLRYREFSWSTYPVLWYVSGVTPSERMRPASFTGPWNLAGLKQFVQMQRSAAKKN